MRFDSGTMRVVSSRPKARRSRVEENYFEDYYSVFEDLVTVLPTLTVDEVIELIESGEAEVADVIAAERVGKARKTVLALTKSDSGKVYPLYNRDQPETDDAQNPVRD